MSMYRSRSTITPPEMRLAIEQRIDFRRRIADVDGTQAAVDMSVKSLSGDYQYLLEVLGHLQVLEMIGELQENILAAALDSSRDARVRGESH